MKFAVVAAALLLPASAAGISSPPEAMPAPKPEAVSPEAFSQPQGTKIPNLLATGGPNCPSIVHQIAEANKSAAARRGEARTLDREPPAHLLLAVDRFVEGCRQVTFLRRNVAPGGMMPNPAD